MVRFWGSLRQTHLAVEEHGRCRRVARLALVEFGVDAAAQLDTLQPVQDEQRDTAIRLPVHWASKTGYSDAVF